jgi:hypothetical protein
MQSPGSSNHTSDWLAMTLDKQWNRKPAFRLRNPSKSGPVGVR